MNASNNMSMSASRKKRPDSGGRRRNQPGAASGDFSGYQIRTDAPDDVDDVAIVERKFKDLEERRIKEWEDHQKAQRSSHQNAGAAQPTKKVFLDFSINEQHAGRLLVELLEETVPETANNFRYLCTGDKFYEPSTGVKLDFIGSPVSKMEPGVAIYTGGLGNLSLSPTGEYFKDESFATRHTTRGLLSMVNQGPNTNGSCFCITLGSVPQFDFKQVVFGRIVDNQSLSVLTELEKVPLTHTGTPKFPITISLCGALSGGEQPRGHHLSFAEWIREKNPEHQDEEEANLTSPTGDSAVVQGDESAAEDKGESGGGESQAEGHEDTNSAGEVVADGGAVSNDDAKSDQGGPSSQHSDVNNQSENDSEKEA